MDTPRIIATPADALDLFMQDMDRDIRDRHPGAYAPPEPTEAPMDTVLPRELTYEDMRLNAEVAVTDAMRRAVGQMPIRSSHDALARDVALGVAMRAFGNPLAEKQRKLISLLREWERTSEPATQADLAAQMEMVILKWRQDAEERAYECDPITGRRA